MDVQKFLQDCIDKNITRSNFVAQLGITYNTLHNWETGKTVPRNIYLERMEEMAEKFSNQNDTLVLDKLRNLVEKKNCNRNKLAAEIGVSSKLIFRWVYDLQTVDSKSMLKIKKIFEEKKESEFLHDENEKIVSLWIKAIKKRMHWDTDTFAAAINTNAETLQSWENGKSTPVLKRIIAINEAIGYHMDFELIKLTEYRKARNISQQSLANIIGVHFTTMMKWENGERVPNSEYYLKLVDFFKESAITKFINSYK